MFCDAGAAACTRLPEVSPRGPHRVRNSRLNRRRHMLRPVIPAALVLLLCCSSAAAAQRRVTGRVTEEGGAPLSSVSITVPGTTVGVITGDNGTFTLMVPAGDVQLNARRIGYRRRTVTVGAAQSDVQIALE